MTLHSFIQYTADVGRTRWLEFAAPDRVLCARSAAEVLPLLDDVERAVNQGWCAAGFISYEAAAALNNDCSAHPSGPLPLVSFGLYRAPVVHLQWPLEEGSFQLDPEWVPDLSRADHAAALARIKEWIASGDTYQVNYTFRLHNRLTGHPRHWFPHLFRAQRPHYAAYVETDDHALCSVSPELFFRLEGRDMLCRPMKGTLPRGRTTTEDRAHAGFLAQSAKNRAENLMIVDMMRNDLGRIAESGSVHTPQLFSVETYPTVHQMTSTVCARTSERWTDILRALFPCASITGAPKVRTTEIIQALEPGPRGIYTGTIGCLLPFHPVTGAKERFAQFNVAIRTPQVRLSDGSVEFGTGGGIVWDSESDSEYEECLTKALVLRPAPPAFSILETLLWTPIRGYVLQRAHLDRLESSAAFFDFPFIRADAERLLIETARTFTQYRQRVRLLLSAAGVLQIEATPLPPLHREQWTVALSPTPVSSQDVFLHHKTTHRTVYERARAGFAGMDDVILQNEHGEITESCKANVVVVLNNTPYTPPVSSGLLNGVFRAALVQRGRLHERVLTPSDLDAAQAVYLINSVRGWVRTNVSTPPRS